MITRHLKLYLTVGDSWGVLSFHPPTIKRVETTHRQECYPMPGEMAWMPHLCFEFIRGVLGRVPEKYVPIRLEMSITEAADEAPEAADLP